MILIGSFENESIAFLLDCITQKAVEDRRTEFDALEQRAEELQAAYDGDKVYPNTYSIYLCYTNIKHFTCVILT